MPCAYSVTLQHGASLDIAQAETHYQHALAPQELGMRPLQAHCHMVSARCTARQAVTNWPAPALSTAIEDTAHGHDLLAASGRSNTGAEEVTVMACFYQGQGSYGPP